MLHLFIHFRLDRFIYPKMVHYFFAALKNIKEIEINYAVFTNNFTDMVSPHCYIFLIQKSKYNIIPHGNIIWAIF